MAGVQVGGPGAATVEPTRQLFAVPVTVALREAGVLGVAGRPALREALARWLVVQAAALHSPLDLAVVVLTALQLEPWAPLRWLPHLRTAGDGFFARVGCDEETVAARLAELSALLEQRLAAGQGEFQRIVVVLDGARRLREWPGVTDILRRGPGVGVHAICLEDDRLRLPEECRALCVLDDAEPPMLTVEQGTVGVIRGVVADQVTAAWAERAARALAPIRDVSRRDARAGIPAVVRLLDLLECATPTPAAIRRRWQAGGHSPRATIGAAEDGPLTIDLRRDGPHALIAGTTGSGKSELLKTLVCSLAFANRPDELNFVLIDYKGGAAFQGCEGLPHVVGMMTDLEPQSTERALTALSAELTRRETVLAAAGASDVYEYWDARARGASGTGEPLPRLLLVIDEFAHVVGGRNVLDDFVHGLVGIARRGRSLGLHLVLATQRPGGGVVSPEIRANANLRIALRVVNDADSADVLGDAAAARISPSLPGRALVHLGEGRPVEFQCARVGGACPGSTAPASRP
jgi:S-DNA-T family DNA segregation ATPase FtsK/SpoIIIE